MSDSNITYIKNNIDHLDHRQQQTLVRFIAKHNTTCLKESADGIRINLDTLDINLVKKIHHFISNQVDYNAFFKDSFEITA
jgi:hypothetical protein